ncbi:hypothetical protein [Frigoriglobus tundricola]|uniref:Uncharacterized protein n=1 Tax=Frigoriglobus tundricola TaxID=2774151 RepID=A0A6M5YVS1_9BACT|nr:hypothetical protein [Frigoriglobus tundricola]QJW97610.1 hypothetical protein FTUN_5185 [Frigoriglobus tundricola]
MADPPGRQPGARGGRRRAPPAARWWAFAPGALPSSVPLWGRTDQPLPLLGGPLLTEPGALVAFGTDPSEVSVGTARTADALACAAAAGWVVLGLVAVRRRARWAGAWPRSSCSIWRSRNWGRRGGRGRRGRRSWR